MTPLIFRQSRKPSKAVLSYQPHGDPQIRLRLPRSNLTCLLRVSQLRIQGLPLEQAYRERQSDDLVLLL